MEHIGRAFGHPKGHVTRCLRRITSELRERFDPPADLWQSLEIADGDAAVGDTQDDRRAAG